MLSRCLRHLAHSAALSVTLFLSMNAPAVAATATAPVLLPTESFFQNPTFFNAALSPDGRHVGMLVGTPGKKTVLAVMDIEHRKPWVVGQFESDVGGFRWVNDKRVVFYMRDQDIAPGETMTGAGLFAVNLDGSEPRELVTRKTPFGRGPQVFAKDVMPWFTHLFSDPGLQDSDSIYVTQELQFRDEGLIVALFTLNTKTGREEPVSRVKTGKTLRWMLDRNAEPRLTEVRDGKKVITYYKDPADNQWHAAFDGEVESVTGMRPFAFDPDGSLYVLSHQGKDKSALYRYDLVNKKLSDKPVIAVDGFDFNGRLVFRNKKLAGVHYLVDAPGTLWFDADMKKIQDQVDKLLPSTINQLSFGVRSATPYMLVTARSDAQPEQTWLYNTATNAIEMLGETQPQIDARQMGRVGMFRYKARDGMEIPTYLTLPKKAGKNLPMVVLVHGGPWVRGGSGLWDGQAQFLASRGYAVLEPQFRGSTGFGNQLLKKGFKQWGLSMQDDLADGAKWAVAQGFADPKRICIAGASYGGYATLMGLIRDPEIFRCGVDWVGVTDIGFMFSVHWSDTDDIAKTYGMPVRIGDPDTDAEQFKATSPLYNAERITQPLLLAYGGVDRRVPLIHGTRFRDAVSMTNKDVEWVEYPEEGHGWALVSTRIDFWNRVEKFLDRNIGKGATP
jgi:dipeptidyl aminopeptidase/acylaminoacyl peptidase